MKRYLVLATLIALTGTAIAQDQAVRVKPDQITFKDNPTIPKGGQSAVLVGDPTKGQVAVTRVKFPANYMIPPHTHPYAEVVTVISGTVGFGSGDVFDKAKGEVVKAGTVNALPAKQSHFVWTEDEEVVLQIQFVGPAGIDYVNPSDDPRKK